jgi:hypothetical protein
MTSHAAEQASSISTKRPQAGEGALRHTSEDLAYLRERGFVETADEIERLHKVEDAAKRIRERLEIRLNNYLCEMRQGEDDSVVGFNEAWDVMRKMFDEDAAKATGER